MNNLSTPSHSPTTGMTPSSTSLVNDERGLSTVEYLILLAVIVVGCVGVWNNIGTAIDEKLGEAQGEVEDIGEK